jgi:hypothetical protein
MANKKAILSHPRMKKKEHEFARFYKQTSTARSLLESKAAFLMLFRTTDEIILEIFNQHKDSGAAGFAFLRQHFQLPLQAWRAEAPVIETGNPAFEQVPSFQSAQGEHPLKGLCPVSSKSSELVAWDGKAYATARGKEESSLISLLSLLVGRTVSWFEILDYLVDQQDNSAAWQAAAHDMIRIMLDANSPHKADPVHMEQLLSACQQAGHESALMKIRTRLSGIKTSPSTEQLDVVAEHERLVEQDDRLRMAWKLANTKIAYLEYLFVFMEPATSTLRLPQNQQDESDTGIFDFLLGHYQISNIAVIQQKQTANGVTVPELVHRFGEQPTQLIRVLSTSAQKASYSILTSLGNAQEPLELIQELDELIHAQRQLLVDQASNDILRFGLNALLDMSGQVHARISRLVRP